MSSRVIGQPISRLDGPPKVTGQAKYTGDIIAEGMLYAVLVPATIPHGRVTHIDVSQAQAAPGVIHIFTHSNTPRFNALPNPPLGHRILPLQDDQILYEGQPVTLVIADMLENAAEAARLVRISYQTAPFATNFLAQIDKAEALPLFGAPPDSAIGDVASALKNTNFRIEGTYATADRHHNPMEPSATLAFWDGERLTVHDSVQGVVLARDALAKVLGLPPEDVRVKCEYVGGGFGCKGWVWPHQILASMATMELGRAVKLVLTRAQSYTSHGYQPASKQKVTIAASADGTLTGIRHESVTTGSFVGDHVEPACWGTQSLYSCSAIETTHRVVRVHRSNPTPMRAPLEGVGLVAVEIAMDELAYELGMDPIDLRLKNYAETDPANGLPFSSKKLRECYEEGARRFGWSARTARPRSMRNGNELIGYGMATALFKSFRNLAKVRLSMDRSGRVLIETSTQEIGTGSRTVFPQIAADILNIPVEQVHLMLGDTNLPPAPINAGSTATLSVGSAIKSAAENLKQKLGVTEADYPTGYQEAMAKLGVESAVVDGEWAPGSTDAENYSLHSFGAIFTEVRIDEELPIPRVRRVVGVYSAGQIINPKTATSQMIGGIVWGIGQALLESSEFDHRLGRYLSKNLAGYLLPVNADVPKIEVAFVEEFDDKVSPIGARGIGELGAIAIGQAIANAVFHATGQRLRSLPIKPEHLLTMP